MSQLAPVGRRSKRLRFCDSCGTYGITPGEVYVEMPLPPRTDPFYADGWTHAAECRYCAERYGRGTLIADRSARR